MDALGYIPASLFAEFTDPAEITPLEPQDAARANGLTLAEYHAAHFRPWRTARLEAETVKASTVRVEDSHVRRYADWDAQPERRPRDWPAGIHWPGLPLRHITPKYLRAYLLELGGVLSVPTVRSHWTTLRTVLNHAQRVGALHRVPQLPDLGRQLRKVAGEDIEPRAFVYSDAELGQLYAALPDVAAGFEVKCRPPRRAAKLRRSIVRELRAAIVLAANCGPRPEDLLLMEFARHVHLDESPPALRYRARKTEKQHHIPLAAVTIAHLEGLQRSHGRHAHRATHLFPHLVNVHARAPMDSGAKRRTVQLLRAALESIDLDADAFQKPLHSLRKSCTTRFNAHGIARGLGSVGKLITHGKDADVASQSYDNPLPTIAQAVESIDWPAEFNACNAAAKRDGQ